MPLSPLKKNKINLLDYDYGKDIECRKLMADLSVFEVDWFNNPINVQKLQVWKLYLQKI